ncbi:MAG TPA: cytochrome B subunit, partial [Pseudobdellovibrionaceae bacterium]|nr:cytochrome B subunit [Pseudobdellovibrionaceae bacterium]
MMAFLRSSIGRKYIMGLTGLVWVGFLAAHMLGNFLLFKGAEAYNEYSHKLITNPLILFAEFVLVGAILIHIFTAISLVYENRKAKSQTQAKEAQGEKATSVASRTMAIHG